MRNDAIRKDIVLALFEAGKDGLTDSGLLLELNKDKKGFRSHKPTSKALILCLFRQFRPWRRLFLLYQNQQEHR